MPNRLAWLCVLCPQLAAGLSVGDGCREQGARRGEVAVAQGGAGCFDIALRLARKRGLRLVELGLDAAVAAGEPLLGGVERVHRGLHRCAPALALLFRHLPLRFRVGDLLPELLHFLDELLELLRVLLRLRTLLLQRLETCPELLKLAMQTLEAAVALRSRTRCGGGRDGAQPAGRIGAK